MLKGNRLGCAPPAAAGPVGSEEQDSQDAGQGNTPNGRRDGHY